MNTNTLRFIAMRTLFAVAVLWVISLLAFVVIQLPEGDIADQYFGSCRECSISQGEEDDIRGYYGLDRRILLQYGFWVTAIISKLDFGPSLREISRPYEEPKRTIKNLLAERLILTIALLAFTSVLIWVVSVPIGIYSATRRGSWGDRAFTFLGGIGLYVPNFLLALLLMYFLLAYFGWNVAGLFSPEYIIDATWSVGKVIDMLQHLIVPGIALGAVGVAKQALLLRETLIDELGKPYVAAARARGMTARNLVFKYIARFALAELLRGFRALLPGLIGGSVIVSVVMSLPTLGSLMLGATTYWLDIYVYGAIFLVLCALGVVGALVLDLILAAVDPRVRLTGKVA